MVIDITQDEAISLYEMFAGKRVADLNAGTLRAIRDTVGLRESPSLVGGRQVHLYITYEDALGIVDDMTDANWTVREDQKIRPLYDKLLRASKGDV